ncbi:MAG: GAF domain-containing protein [Armatimonadota bacterium]|nr:MAG: GAF domain-containing protein [Armatimonadota bacterium]
MSLNGAARLAEGQSYLGLPAPLRIAADHAIHLFSESPFSRSQREIARQAAERLGAKLAQLSACGDEGEPAARTFVPQAPAETGQVAIEQLLSDAMRAAAETLTADTCSLMVLDEANGTLVLDAAYGLRDGVVRGQRRPAGEGIASYVMSLGEPVILDDPLKDPRLRGLAVERRPDISCSICVPITPHEGFRGMVSFNRTGSAEPFTQDDLRLATTVASQLGPCFANARRYQQAAERLDELAVISRVAESVTPTMDVERVAGLLADGIAQAAGIERCRLYLGQGEQMKLAAACGYAEGSAPALQTPADEAVVQAAAEARPVVVHGDRASSGDESHRHTPVGAFAALPLICRGRALGVFCADCGSDESLRRINIELIENLLGRAAIALHNATTHQRLREDLDDLYRLYDSVQRINTSFEPEDILNQTAHEVKLLTGCRRVGFASLAPESDSLGGRSASLVTLPLAADDGAMGEARAMSAPMLLDGDTRMVSSGAADLAAAVRELTGEGRALVMPLTHELGSLGLLVGWSFAREPRAREVSLAAGLCAHGAALLRKAMDYRAAINARSLELSALYQLCEEISAATSFESALRSVLEIAHSMVPYDEGLVFIWSEESGRLELAASRGVDFEAINAQAPQAQPGNMYQWVYAEGKAFISTDIGQVGGDSSSAGPLLRSSMAVPLVIGNETIGVLAIHNARSRAYTEGHVKVLSIVASQAAAIYRALQSLGRLSRYTDNILESMVAGVIGLDRAGRVVIWSPAAREILGISASHAAGTDFSALAHQIGREHGGPAGRSVESLALMARRLLVHGEPVPEQELRLERNGAPPRVLIANCTPLRGADGELTGAVLLIEDVTERKRMEERMRQMSQLAAVGHLAANVAHEIRNPLSAIKTAAQFLSTEYQTEGLIAQFSGIINEECDRLSKVATDFLTYARPNEPSLERTAVIEIIESAVAATAREMTERNIRVDVRGAKRVPRISADPEAMRQVFVNLLTNAAQAIGSDGEVRIALRARSAAHDGRAVEVTISDTGPGIPEEALERVWTPFFSTRTKGTGLGLSIVRKTIEAHGGQIWAEQPRDGGACFRMRLPVRRRKRAQAAAAAAVAGADQTPQWQQLDLFADETPRPAGDGNERTSDSPGEQR